MSYFMEGVMNFISPFHKPLVNIFRQLKEEKFIYIYSYILRITKISMFSFKVFGCFK